MNRRERVVRAALLAGLVLLGLGAVLVGAGQVITAVRYNADAGTADKTVRQYLIPGDVTQKDAGTCWVEVRKSGRGHVTCFGSGEKSQTRPYVRDSVAQDGETWTTR